mgnify:CR=1 FL=1
MAPSAINANNPNTEEKKREPSTENGTSETNESKYPERKTSRRRTRFGKERKFSKSINLGTKDAEIDNNLKRRNKFRERTMSVYGRKKSTSSSVREKYSEHIIEVLIFNLFISSFSLIILNLCIPSGKQWKKKKNNL